MSAHVVAQIEDHVDGARVALVEGRPSAPALKFGSGRVQRRLACTARKVTLVCGGLERGVLTLVRCIGALAAENLILLGRELSAPLVFGLDYGCGRRRDRHLFEGGREVVVRISALLNGCRLLELDATQVEATT